MQLSDSSALLCAQDRTANEMAQLELTDTEMERVGDALLTQAAHVVAERDPDKMVLLQQELEITARKHQVKVSVESKRMLCLCWAELNPVLLPSVCDRPKTAGMHPQSS